MKTETKVNLIIAGIFLAAISVALLFNIGEVKLIVFNILN